MGSVDIGAAGEVRSVTSRRTGENMRFMLCARDRSSGSIRLVSDDSFASRQDAVAAISGLPGAAGFAGMEIFLVDLDAATPVAVVPCAVDGGAASSVPATRADDDEEDDAADSSPQPSDVGVVAIDIDDWSCEDCIYISTCAKQGTIRPAECGAFQWRA
jgi:hypothetical protein